MAAHANAMAEMDHRQNTEQREDKYGDHGGDHQRYLQQKRQEVGRTNEGERKGTGSPAASSGLMG